MPASSVRGNSLAAEALPAPNGTAAHKQLTVDGTAGGVQFTAFGANTEKVWVQILGADVWVTFDGTTPSATNGMTLFDGYDAQWNVEAATAAKFLRTTATSAVANAAQLLA